MIDDGDVGLGEIAGAVAPAQQKMDELARALGGLGIYVCALIPGGRTVARDTITAVTPRGETLHLSIAMVDALEAATPILAGVHPVSISVPADDLQGELWRSESARVQELDLTLRLRGGHGKPTETIEITAPWGLSPGHVDLVLVCAERPAGWPP